MELHFHRNDGLFKLFFFEWNIYQCVWSLKISSESLKYSSEYIVEGANLILTHSLCQLMQNLLNRKTFNSILNCFEKCLNTNYTHHYLGIWQQFLFTSLFFCVASLFVCFFFSHFLFANLLALNLNNENARW